MSKSPVFQELNALLEKTRKAAHEYPWEDKNFYCAWLAQTTYYVRHSTRLLALGGAMAPLQQQELHNRFLKHAAEEKGHENLTVLDLKFFNEKVESIPEFPMTQSFYQTQYYWIEHKSPLAFFGYILCLECMAVKIGPIANSRIDKAFGPKASHFLRVHAEEDVDHVDEAVAKVEKFPAEIQAMVIENMRQAFQNYSSMMDSCIEYAHAAKKNAA